MYPNNISIFVTLRFIANVGIRYGEYNKKQHQTIMLYRNNATNL